MVYSRMGSLGSIGHPMGNCGTHGMSVVGGPDAAASGDFSSQQYFLAGDEIAVTSFFSSGYDAQYHTMNGVEVSDEAVLYAPQLAPELVALLEQPYTVLLRGIVRDTGGGFSSSRVYLLTDNDIYFEAQIQGDLNGYFDGSDAITEAASGYGEYCMVWTHTVNGVSLSVNGNTVQTYPSADALGDITGALVLGVRKAICTEFTIYPPQDDIDLPSLSAL